MQLNNKYRFELTSVLKRGLNEAQKETINSEVGNARQYLNLLVNKIEKEVDDKSKEAEKAIDYSDTTWPYKQAELLGYKRALRKILDIIGPKDIKND